LGISGFLGNISYLLFDNLLAVVFVGCSVCERTDLKEVDLDLGYNARLALVAEYPNVIGLVLVLAVWAKHFRGHSTCYSLLDWQVAVKVLANQKHWETFLSVSGA